MIEYVFELRACGFKGNFLTTYEVQVPKKIAGIKNVEGVQIFFEQAFG
jgi:hypothetical protein